MRREVAGEWAAVLKGYSEGMEILFLRDDLYWVKVECLPNELKEAHRYKIAKTTKVPFAKETSPRHLEVEVEDGSWVVAVKKDDYGAHFDDIIISWENLMRFKQWDGSPCYLEVSV